MRDNRFINNIFDFIEVIIDFDNKLYKKANIFFKLTIKY